MPFVPGAGVIPHVLAAKSALGLTNAQLGEAMGVSERTVVRWWGNRSHPGTEAIGHLVVAVHPVEPSLAATLAAKGGHTLESLGLPALQGTPAASPHAQPPSPPPRPFPPSKLLVEAIVGTAAQAMQVTPSAVRGAVLAAFACARGLGLTVEEVESALAEASTGATPYAGAASSGSGALPARIAKL